TRRARLRTSLWLTTAPEFTSLNKTLNDVGCALQGGWVDTLSFDLMTASDDTCRHLLNDRASPAFPGTARVQR
ncbi:MAG: hypothetical protein AAFQ17_04240, partial [Pseudomonadota bacterium]